jgi:antitoxin (DNA-binding transcriptional repressor) of toxin-antitoxin stability system
MATIGLSELPAALRTVLEQGEALDIMDQGAVVARLVPVAPARPARPGLADDLAALDALSARISAAWKDDMSAVEAINDVRREL